MKGHNNTPNTKKAKILNGEQKIIQGKFLEERINHAPPVIAKNNKQKEVLKALQTKQVVVVEAPAGFGKSYLVATKAIDDLVQGKIKKIILSRPAVGMGPSIGLLKGDMRSKFEPYLMPLVEVITERWGHAVYETNLDSGNIEFAPLEYLRGRNFKGVTIIDEGQNTTPSEMYTILTRLHDDGKLFIIGDRTQNDLKGQTGIEWLCEFIERHDLHEKVEVIRATSDDIVRGSFCKAVVQAKESDVKSGFGLEKKK